MNGASCRCVRRTDQRSGGFPSATGDGSRCIGVPWSRPFFSDRQALTAPDLRCAITPSLRSPPFAPISMFARITFRSCDSAPVFRRHAWFPSPRLACSTRPRRWAPATNVVIANVSGPCFDPVPCLFAACGARFVSSRCRIVLRRLRRLRPRTPDVFSIARANSRILAATAQDTAFRSRLSAAFRIVPARPLSKSGYSRTVVTDWRPSIQRASSLGWSWCCP